MKIKISLMILEQKSGFILSENIIVNLTKLNSYLVCKLYFKAKL